MHRSGFVCCVLALASVACTSEYDPFVTRPGATSASGASASDASGTSTSGAPTSGSGAGGTGVGASTSSGGGAEQGGAGGVPLPCSPGNSYTLTDDFEDGITAAAWTPGVMGLGEVLFESGGMLQFTAADSFGSYNNYAVYVAGPFDIRGCSVLVHAVSLPLDDVQTFIAFGTNQFNDAVAIGADMATISFCVATAGQSQCDDLAHRPGGDDWWRIREEAGTVKLETAPDGKTWTTRKETPTPAYAVAGDVELGMGSADPVDFTYSGALDDFNLPPP